MNTHVKITDSAATDLSRRSFLVGSAATGLVLGYAAVPKAAAVSPSLTKNCPESSSACSRLASSINDWLDRLAFGPLS